MLGTFTYCNPTKLYFGEGAVKHLSDELPKYGKNVVLVYGGGSIKKNGIYDTVVRILKENGKTVAEIAGVMPNPTLEKLYEGIGIARKAHAELILAVGGGSVCDYAKALSVSVCCEEDPWEKYYVRFEVRDQPGVIADIARILGNEKVSIASMIQRGRAQGGTVPLIMTFHKSKESAVTAALAEIERLDCVLDKPCMIRIERL